MLEFPQGLSRRATLRRAEAAERLAEAGTEVSFEVPVSPGHREAGQLRSEPTVVLGRLCPTIGVDLVLELGEQQIPVVDADDWRELPAEELVARIGAGANRAQTDRIRPLRGAGGELVGRAAAISSGFFYGDHAPALVTIGGLAARSGSRMLGVLLADTPNLARASGRALLPPERLTEWAGEQAALWVDSGLDGDEGISMAAMLAGFGADVSGLPICRGFDNALNREQLRVWSSEQDRIVYWPEVEEEDLIHAGGESTFVPAEDTIVGSRVGSGGVLGELVEIPNDVAIDLGDLILSSIAAGWGLDVDRLLEIAERDGLEMVGETEYAEVFTSSALVFKRD